MQLSKFHIQLLQNCVSDQGPYQRVKAGDQIPYIVSTQVST